MIENYNLACVISNQVVNCEISESEQLEVRKKNFEKSLKKKNLNKRENWYSKKSKSLKFIPKEYQ